MSFAPIVLFVYKRPIHTIKTVEALKRNIGAEQSDLIVFSDAPKNIEDVKSVEEVRHYLNKISGFKSVKINKRDINYGLSKSIIDGVTEIIEEYGKIIVLEDDLLTSSLFLKFMNDALEKFQHNERIVSIHGYVYPIQNLPNFFFLTGADCWGWATWKRGWDLFEENGLTLLNELYLKKLTSRFDYFGTYPFTRMLKEQVEGKNNSWAIRWHASAFLKNKYTLYPGTSFVRNIGNDSSGTHKGDTNIYDAILNTNYKTLPDNPIIEDKEAVQKISKYFRNTHTAKKNYLSRIKSYFKKLT